MKDFIVSADSCLTLAKSAGFDSGSIVTIREQLGMK